MKCSNLIDLGDVCGSCEQVNESSYWKCKLHGREGNTSEGCPVCAINDAVVETYFYKKPEITVDMCRKAFEEGVKFGWAACNDGYMDLDESWNESKTKKKLDKL
jgi:SRSO17 transposase